MGAPGRGMTAWAGFSDETSEKYFEGKAGY